MRMTPWKVSPQTFELFHQAAFESSCPQELSGRRFIR
jgi:hypothetical protein